MKNFCERKQKEVRWARELKPVLYQEIQEDFIVYEVCRGEKETEFLRYDLTLIHPRALNQELPKTFGHYHLQNEPELYEVIEGEALFLFQKFQNNPFFIEEVYLVEAKEKDQIVVLPGWGMTSYNPSTKEVLIGNWVKKTTVNDYQSFQKTRGASYYLLKKENGWEALKNPFYQQVPELIFLKPKKLPEELANLEFLNQPSEYSAFLTLERLYFKI